MSRRTREQLLFYGSLALALLLMLVPLPQALEPIKPWWPALVLIYWTIEDADHVGLGFAFGFGLLADLLTGVMFGDQALRLLVIVFISLRFRARLRFFPMYQQSAAVGVLLLNDALLRTVIRALAGLPLPSAASWLAPILGALLWPFLFLLLDSLRARLRDTSP